MNEKLQEIKRRVSFDPETCMSVKRIPKQAKIDFVKLANDKFTGDYGMTILYLTDFYNGILSQPNEEVSAKIDLVAEQVALLQNKMNEPLKEKVEIKTIDGRIIK